MKVRYSASAQAEIDEILAYISADNSTAADRLAAAIDRTVEWIGKFPVASPIVYRGLLRSKLVVGYQYRVFYTIEDGEVAIVSVRSTRRLRPWEE